MKTHPGLRIAALAIALAVSGAAAAQETLTEAQVRARLTDQGYTKINDIIFADGVWKADARSAEGNRVDVRLDPQTGRVYPDEQVANLSEAELNQMRPRSYPLAAELRAEPRFASAKSERVPLQR